MFARLPTVAIIDGPHFYAATRALGWDVDYKLFPAWLDEATVAAGSTNLRRLVYCTALQDEVGADRENPLLGLVRWLGFNGYIVRVKLAREWTEPETGRRRLRFSSAVELTVAMVEAAEHVAQLVLVTGDGDMTPAVDYVQRRHGARVVSVSTTRAPDGSMIADSLRAQADAYLDLADLETQFGKPLAAARRRLNQGKASTP
ncbi:NYN domain-containing protein [Falsiroseomonas sp. HW251]|uniref:NYN domain-containing protein n=1 Tax=Falsiroseomonas sp. HW251 TaxID=3390998 RepID=UPI003D3144A4